MDRHELNRMFDGLAPGPQRERELLKKLLQEEAGVFLSAFRRVLRWQNAFFIYGRLILRTRKRGFTDVYS